MTALCSASRLQSNTEGEPTEAGNAVASATSRQPYRRRSSDPHTLRERMDFRRDHKYGRHRPLPDVPWRQHKEKTYLDDAERLYGRKETWHTVENEELREKLVAILQDYLRDTIAGAQLEIRDARKYRHLCNTSAKEYRAHLTAGAFGAPTMLQDWAGSILSHRSGPGVSSSSSMVSSGASDATAGGNQGEGDANTAHGGTGETTPTDSDLEEWRERRRRRGAEAVLEGSVAVADLPERDTSTAPVSAFPFLRQRAVESEHTLDPSLVDWTAKYFPTDDRGTFRAPPEARQRQTANTREGGMDDADGATSSAGDGIDAPSAAGQLQSRRSGFGNPPSAFDDGGLRKHHARHRLHRSLRSHEDRHRATFDAEGVFYHLRQQGEDDERVPQPKPVRGSEVSAPGNNHPSFGGVVKVPWGVVSTSKKQGYTPDILRAKERLIRLSRGEDPETIP